MASLRDSRRRIMSVKNTRQITRAMKLVAGARLRKATESAMDARPYQHTLSAVLGRVAGAAGDVEHPLLRVPDNDEDVIVVLLSSDRGLCGSFNSAILRFTQDKIDALIEQGHSVKLYCYGKKAVGHFKKRGYDIAWSQTDVDPDDYAAVSHDLAGRLVALMDKDAFHRVYLAFNEFRSVMTQTPSFKQLLPMVIESAESAEAPEGAPPAAQGNEYLFEPGATELLGTLLPMALRTTIFQSFLETQAGEQASRMTAMDSATRNASELIEALTLEYNRARQAAITTELIEIVSGAEAL